MTNLDKLNKLFDDYLTTHRKSFISLRTGNDLLKNSKDPDLQNIDLKKLLESGMLPHSGQTQPAPKQWRIFHSKQGGNLEEQHNSEEVVDRSDEFVNHIKYNAATKTFSNSKNSDGKYEYDKIAIIALIIIGSLFAIFTLMKPDQMDEEKRIANSKGYDNSNEVETYTQEFSHQSDENVQAVLEETNQLLNDLLSFKDNEDFHYYGFAGQGKYGWWMKRADELKNSPYAKQILLERGFSLGDLQMLGLEYVKSKGQETEYSNWAKKRILDGILPYRF